VQLKPLHFILSSAAIASVSAFAAPAHALSVNVGGQSYNVGTLSGSFSNNASLLQSQPWWGDVLIAADFARAVGTGLGLPNSSGASGPYFSAYDGGISNFSTYIDGTGQLGIFGVVSSTIASYAVTTSAVPGPLPILGAFAAFGFSRKLRKRIQLNNSAA